MRTKAPGAGTATRSRSNTTTIGSATSRTLTCCGRRRGTVSLSLTISAERRKDSNAYPSSTTAIPPRPSRSPSTPTAAAAAGKRPSSSADSFPLRRIPCARMRNFSAGIRLPKATANFSTIPRVFGRTLFIMRDGTCSSTSPPTACCSALPTEQCFRPTSSSRTGSPG